MFKQEIESAIRAQAEEADVLAGMPREALSDLPVERNFATIVTGVRRCGKSTLLVQWAKQSRLRVVRILFDDLRLMDFTTDDFVLLGKILVEHKAQAVVLDEVQDIPGWERFVSGLLPTGMTVLVTGSNAKMLSAELGTKLTGRHLDLRLDPFSYTEFLRFRKRTSTTAAFDEYMSVGGFPAYVQSRMRQILVDLFNDILYRDVVVRYGIGNTMPIKQLAAYLLNHIGTRLAPSRLKDAIHVQSAKTVLEYFDHLTECCLIHRLERFADSPKARMLAQKKVYACDVGLVSVLERGEGVGLGHKLENLVFLKLRKKGGDLTYFLDAQDRECDFVRESEDGSYEAVQVCWELTDDNRKREFDGLTAAMRRFGLRKGVIVTHDQDDEAIQDGCEISVVSAVRYFNTHRR